MLTKEQLMNVGVERLADIILSLCQNSLENQKQLEIILADLDLAEKLVSVIKEKILSLEAFADSLQYYESDSLAGEINKIRNLIMKELLPKSSNCAVELLLSLLDSQNVVCRVDDSDCTVGEVFGEVCTDLVIACERSTMSIEDKVKIVYDRYMSNDYGFYSDVISDFKDVLGDEGLKELQKKLGKSFNQKYAFKTSTIKGRLESIEHFQNDVGTYIQACSSTGSPQGHELLDIAKHLIKYGRGEEALNWLDSPDLAETRFWREKAMPLKIQALELCGNYKDAQSERLKFFCGNLSLEVYNAILKCAKSEAIDSWKNAAVQIALQFRDPLVALNFLIKIQEFEQASKLVYQKIDILNDSNCCILRPIADILCKTDPLAATLLYRKLVKPPLVRSKHYAYKCAADYLAVCHSLSSKVTDWQKYKSHELYFEELSVQHKRKTKFWSEYYSPTNKRQKMSV